MDVRQIVVAYDFSPEADVALEHAVELACRAPDHVLHFVTAIDPHRGVGTQPRETVTYHYAEQVQKTLAARLETIFTARAPACEVHFFVHARIGDAVDEILELANDVGADLIVLGSHGRTGVWRLVLGSVSETVVRRARCPVIVARPKGYKEVALEKVVVAPGPHPRHVRPHRYSYTGHQMLTRPPDSPIN